MSRILMVLVMALAMGIPPRLQAQEGVLPRVSAVEAGLDETALRATTELLESYVANGAIAGAVAAVARDGKVGYLAAVGVQDLETGRPMNDRSIFRIYSMAKTVTAVGALMLYEKGHFQLDDPVEQYIPEFGRVRVRTDSGELRSPARPVTVRDLLLHTSGMSHRTGELYRELGVRSRSDALPQFIDNVTRAPLVFNPGSDYLYSESPTVVGRLIEIWSGEPLDVFLERRIFEPLGMVDTGFWVEPEDRDRLTEVYRPDSQGRLQAYAIEEVPFTERPALLEGAVGLVSTVADYLRFAQTIANGGSLGGVRLLQPETVEMAVANGLSREMTAARNGRGWGPGNVAVYEAQGEYGWDGSAGTIFWIHPDSNTVAVLMTQTSPAFPDGLRQRFKSAIEESILD